MKPGVEASLVIIHGHQGQLGRQGQGQGQPMSPQLTFVWGLVAFVHQTEELLAGQAPVLILIPLLDQRLDAQFSAKKIKSFCWKKKKKKKNSGPDCPKFYLTEWSSRGLVFFFWGGGGQVSSSVLAANSRLS